MITLKNWQVAPGPCSSLQVTGIAVPTWAPLVPPAHPEPVRVSLVASDPQARQAVSRQLGADPRTALVAWARTLDEGRQLCEAADVLLVEHELDDGDGIDLVRHLKQACPRSEAIVMTHADDEEAAARALDAGAAGWLVLREGVSNLALTVLHVAGGGAAISPSLARRLMRRSPQDEVRTRLQTKLGTITSREREVLAQVARGLRSKEIARQLAISDETVNAHVKSLYRKLHVHSRSQLVLAAALAGFC